MKLDVCNAYAIFRRALLSRRCYTPKIVLAKPT
nr:MAG TPA: hypothetical protein [Microviridae sp.]